MPSSAESGDHKAAEVALNVMERRRRLLGLDRPGEWPTGAAGEPEPPGMAYDLSKLSDEQLLEWQSLMVAARGNA